jgi:hypothetical protein
MVQKFIKVLEMKKINYNTFPIIHKIVINEELKDDLSNCKVIDLLALNCKKLKKIKKIKKLKK